jgi:hypothetical protein
MELTLYQFNQNSTLSDGSTHSSLVPAQEFAMFARILLPGLIDRASILQMILSVDSDIAPEPQYIFVRVNAVG